MKLSQRKLEILSTIASSPRHAKHFTHGNLERITSPVIMEKWLSKMAEDGYLYEENNVYSITQKGRQALDVTCESEKKPITWKKSVYVTGDGETSIYQRPGSDHSHIPSFGFKC